MAYVKPKCKNTTALTNVQFLNLYCGGNDGFADEADRKARYLENRPAFMAGSPLEWGCAVFEYELNARRGISALARVCLADERGLLSPQDMLAAEKGYDDLRPHGDVRYVVSSVELIGKLAGESTCLEERNSGLARHIEQAEAVAGWHERRGHEVPASLYRERAEKLRVLLAAPWVPPIGSEAFAGKTSSLKEQPIE